MSDSEDELVPQKYVSGFWIRNAGKLQSILKDGIVYLDLVFRDNFYSVFISAVKFGDIEYAARSLEIFSIYEKVREANSPAFSINGNCMGSFNEPSTVACMLMVQGYEVYVGKSTRFVGGINFDQLLKAKREYEYVDFAEMLSLASMDKDDSSLDEKLGGTFGGEKPFIKNSKLNPIQAKRVLLSPEELE